jgi:fermentation-respiration switch protein FrsA (DUF1100 family)
MHRAHRSIGVAAQAAVGLVLAGAPSALLALALALPAAAQARTGPARFAVGIRVLRLVDESRRIRLPGGRTEPRTLVTYVRYPAFGSPAGPARWGAPAAVQAGPFPLIVFGHGFTATPALYSSLLTAWAAAGYVVAAPVFPLENANAPGGPNERDIVNQPQDTLFLIARLLTSNRAHGSPLPGLLDPGEIALAGHSDGGETALVAAFDPVLHLAAVRAAVILSGARTPYGLTRFPAASPALLATQGTADPVNPPAVTDAFFAIAPRPKFLLELPGAGHLTPYTEQPDLGIVERVSIAFLDRYLKHGPPRGIVAAADAPGLALLRAYP